MSATVMMGIDPGSHATGYAFLRMAGSKVSVLGYGVIRPRKDSELIFRIGHIADALDVLIDAHEPNHFCMEKAFFAKNANSALVLGHIRGAIMALGFKRGLIFSERSPRSVKQAVTGSGSASKEQVARMAGRLLGVELNCALDASDALAIAWSGLAGS